MMDIGQIRHANARLLVRRLEAKTGKTGKRAGGIAMLSRKLKKSTGQVSHFAGEEPIKEIGNVIARQIEKAFDLEYGWMDWLHDDDDAASQQSRPLRLDPDTLVETVRSLHERLRDGARVCALIESQPQKFIAAFGLYANSTSDKRTPEMERELAMKLADLTPQGANEDERRETVPAQGTTERTVGTGGRRKH
jgi:hypothetical protein